MSAACFLSHMELTLDWYICLHLIVCMWHTQIKLGALLRREVEIHREGRDTEQSVAEMKAAGGAVCRTTRKVLGSVPGR